MKYLFDINDEIGSDIHEVLGFVDADFSTKQLLPYVRKSTKEIVRLIGDANYQIAVSAFESEEFDNDFLVLVRYAITLGAFREFAPLADLSYTTYGRGVRSEEHFSAPYEWRLDRSDDAMERSYYAAINEIFYFVIDQLEDQADPDAEDTEIVFVEFPFLKKLRNLYVSSMEIFESFVKINSSFLLFFNLIPALEKAERKLIASRVGALDPRSDEDMLELVQNICIDYAMIDGMRKNSVQLFPRGVLKESTGNARQTAAKQFDIEASILYYQEELDALLLDLESAVAKHKGKPAVGELINFNPNDGFVTM